MGVGPSGTTRDIQFICLMGVMMAECMSMCMSFRGDVYVSFPVCV